MTMHDHMTRPGAYDFPELLSLHLRQSFSFQDHLDLTVWILCLEVFIFCHCIGPKKMSETSPVATATSAKSTSTTTWPSTSARAAKIGKDLQRSGQKRFIDALFGIED